MPEKPGVFDYIPRGEGFEEGQDAVWKRSDSVRTVLYGGVDNTYIEP